MGELIDTTEMYLKAIFELEEDGVTPLRARIVDRLGHSGPTVSQTVSRMERDGLLHVLGDRRLELTRDGWYRAREVMRKHRLAERLLLDIIGLGWADVHEEACRWEHVMSEQVEARLVKLLGVPQTDPYGNHLPGIEIDRPEVSVEVALRESERVVAPIARIGEPIQAEVDVLARFEELGLFPTVMAVAVADEKTGDVLIRALSDEGEDAHFLRLNVAFVPHLFFAMERK